MRHAAIIALSALALAGCATIDNDRTTVGGDTLTGLDESGVPRFEPAAGPSVSGPDRGNWEEVTVVVEVDTTQHHPVLTNGGPAFAKDTARQRGEFPSALDALELGAAGGDQVAELFAAPFYAAGDVLMAVPRLFAAAGQPQTSPRRWYERAPATAESLAPALEPATAPVSGGVVE